MEMSESLNMKKPRAKPNRWVTVKNLLGLRQINAMSPPNMFTQGRRVCSAALPEIKTLTGKMHLSFGFHVEVGSSLFWLHWCYFAFQISNSICSFSFIDLFIFHGVGLKPKASFTLAECSTTALHLQPGAGYVYFLCCIEVALFLHTQSWFSTH